MTGVQTCALPISRNENTNLRVGIFFGITLSNGWYVKICVGKPRRPYPKQVSNASYFLLTVGMGRTYAAQRKRHLHKGGMPHQLAYCSAQENLNLNLI